MKLTPHQPDRPPRVPARSVLESPAEESSTKDLKALLSSPLFQAMREKFRTDVLIGGEDLASLTWVLSVDPTFRTDVRNKLGLKDDALEMLAEKEASLAEMQKLNSNPDAGIKVDGLETQACQTGSTVVQFFPEERNQNPFSQFTLDRLDRVLEHSLKGFSDLSIISAYRLITLWPTKREKIIEELFLVNPPEPELVTQFFSRPDFYSPTPGGSAGRRRHRQGEVLECFLLIFPEYRPLLSKQIGQRKQKLRSEIASIDPSPTPDPGEFRLARVLSLQRELIVLGCEGAKLNAVGQLELPFPRSLGTPKQLPVRLEL